LIKTAFSLVPPQTPDNVNPLINKYLEAEFAKLGSKNTLSLEELHGGRPWVADVNHWNFEAAKLATKVCLAFTLKTATLLILLKAVYKREPDLTREGGSIPVTLTFAESLGVNVVLLPMGRGDDGAQYVTQHALCILSLVLTFPSSTNEKLDRSNYIEGVSPP
jgi:Cys-Gly metallodipeptidase DUG1